jgi:hypothetical protein
MCDEWVGLYEHPGFDGCVLVVAPAEVFDVGVADHWQPAGLFFAVAVLVCLAALVVSQLRG